MLIHHRCYIYLVLLLSPRASSFDTSVKSCAKGGEPLNINGICVLLSMYVTVCIFQCHSDLCNCVLESSTLTQTGGCHSLLSELGG